MVDRRKDICFRTVGTDFKFNSFEMKQSLNETMALGLASWLKFSEDKNVMEQKEN